MSTYVIAVRREMRDQVPPGWDKLLADIDGLSIRGTANPNRIQVDASDAAIADARERLGDCFYIEPASIHKVLN
jgi:hypothetical protein